MNAELQGISEMKQINNISAKLERDYSPEQIQKTVAELEKTFTDIKKEQGTHISPKMEILIDDLVVQMKLDPIHVIASLIVKHRVGLAK